MTGSMAAVPIIDLTSSPEPDESPSKIATAALAQFQPSKERRKRANAQPPHDLPAHNVALSNLHSAPSHSVPFLQGYGRAQSARLPLYGHPQDDYRKSSLPPWPSKTREQNGQPVTGAHYNPVHQKSLAWLLQQEARESSTCSQPAPVTSESHTRDLTRDRERRKENVAIPNWEQSVGNTKARPSNGSRPSGAVHSTTVPNHGPQANIARTHQPEPVILTSPIQATTGANPPLFKRPASALQNNGDSAPHKRQRTSIEGHREIVQNSASEPSPPHVHRPWLVDVTDSNLDEHLASSDDALEVHLRGDQAQDIGAKTGNSALALPNHDQVPKLPDHVQNSNPRVSNHGNPYSAEEDQLLYRLKAVEGLSWDDIVPLFNGRTKGSLQVRFSTKLMSKPVSAVNRTTEQLIEGADSTDVARSQSPDPTSRPKRKRKPAAAAQDGLISWTEVISARRAKVVTQEPEPEEPTARDDCPLSAQDRALPNPMSRLLRQRELGKGGGRAWQSQTRSMSDELREHVCSGYSLSHFHQGTSGDVLSVSWSPDGTRFAAGSAAISDSTSMQYNMSRNLLLGDIEHGELRELVEHHEPRPVVSDNKNINASHAMRASQDPRLFVTVTATSFSRDGTSLYTAGKDKKLRVYSTDQPLRAVECRYEIDHAAAIDVLSVSHDGLVATGCHMPNESINVYRCGQSNFQHAAAMSPIRSQEETLGSSLPLYPASLKWGIAPQHRGLLLAGFCNDSSVLDEKQYSGATCVWDLQHQQQIPLRGVTCNVFDVSWNPLPSSASAALAVASNPSGIAVNKGIKSVVQLFAPNQDALRRVLLWQCPALDINDIVFCPHDSNLIACGATDGKVYVWDQRSADRSQQPLHILAHGESLTVLPDIDRELIDTGVRFLSWGASRTRLYSGSSDGVIKVWNPYRSAHNTEVDEFTTPSHQRSAIMAGAFSSDSRSLLVGTEVGQINMFSIGQKGQAQQAKRWKMHASPSPSVLKRDPCIETKALLASGKIEFRPCGALPLRQAVQGPNYDGPFAASTIEIGLAQDVYQLALDTQNRLHLSGGVDEVEFERAATRVKDALAALTDQEDRLAFHQSCQPKAEAFQRSLFAAETYQKLLKSALAHPEEPCQLGCSYFEATSESAADSGASNLRIPGFLGLLQMSTAPESPSDDGNGGTSSSALCPSCNPFSRKRKKRIMCRQCILKRAGLTATCTKCSAPAKPATHGTEKSVCAKCNFACFRCGRSAPVSIAPESVHCSACNLTWETGVLGYELLIDQKGRNPLAGANALDSIHDDNDDEIGYTEIEHYASRWRANAPHAEVEHGLHFASR